MRIHFLSNKNNIIIGYGWKKVKFKKIFGSSYPKRCTLQNKDLYLKEKITIVVSERGVKIRN